MDPASPHLVGGGGSTSSHPSMSPPTSPGGPSSKIVTSLIIDFTPIWGPRVRRKVGGNGELSHDEEEWLVQFITKDLLHMQQAASQRKMDEMAALAAAASRKSMRNSTILNQGVPAENRHAAATAGANSAGPSSSNSGAAVGEGTGSLPPADAATLDETCFVKVICIDQLHVAVVVMFFSIEDEGDGSDTAQQLMAQQMFQASGLSQSHMYAVAIAIQNFSAIRLRVALPSIRDWVFHAHQEILALAYDEDWSVVASLPRLTNQQHNNAAVAVVGGVAAAGAPTFNAVTPVFTVGKGAPRISATEIVRQAEAALVSYQRSGSVAGAGPPKVGTPGHRHALLSATDAAAAAAIAAAAAVHHASSEGASVSPSRQSDPQQPTSIDIELEWYAKLCIFNPLLDTWIREHIDRDKIDIDATIFRKSDWSASQLCSVLTAAMAHHRCVIRADDAELVTEWLNSLTLFIADDRLLFASNRCFRPSTSGSALWSPILAPDLNLQGTTASVNDILERYHEFRYPPVILDVSRRLDEPAHFFPTMTLTVFTEMRRLIFSRQKSIRPAWDIPHSKQRPSTLKHSTLVSSIVTRIKQISNAVMSSMYQTDTPPHPSGLGPRSVAAQPPSNTNTPRLGPVARSSPGTILLPPTVGDAAGHVPNASFTTQYELPGFNGGGYLSAERQHRAALDAIVHWRKQLLLRAMALYVQEMELHKEIVENKELAAIFRIPEADHKVLCVAVDFIALVQQAKERRVRTVLVEAMTW